MLSVLCLCGALNSLRNEVLQNQTVAAAVRGVVISVLVPELPVVRCVQCGFVGIDGTADGAIRWALVTAGALDCDETHSNSREHLRQLL